MWPNDAIWQHRSGSTLAQVMVCCLTAPSHYFNQCWLIISKIQLHSSDGNFTRDTSVMNDYYLGNLSYSKLCNSFHLSPPGQNGRHFADDIFKWISMNEKFCILIRISLKCVHKGRIDEKSALVQVMAWCGPDDKPLPEAMLIQFIDAYIRH